MGTGSCKNCPVWKKSAFARLSDNGLDRLEQAKISTEYRRGDAFSRKDQPADTVYCLRSGSAKVTMSDEQTGRQSLVKLVVPGDMLGYRCIFSAQKFRGSATALNSSVACTISKDVIFDLIQTEPLFSLELLRRMGLEVASSEYHHHSFCQKNARERLAEALLILKRKYGVKSETGWKIDTRLTRSELANWIGCSRETVIRELTELIGEKAISIDDHVIFLVDLAYLEKIGSNGLGSRGEGLEITSQ